MTPTITDLIKSLPQDGIEAWRKQALNAFVQTGFPHRKMENWKYTDLNRLLAGNTFTPAMGSEQTVQARASDLNSIKIVLIDGKLSATDSQLNQLPDGLQILSLADALKRMPQLVIQHIQADNHYQQNPMLALNCALMSDGVVIHVAANTQVKQPIELIYCQSADMAQKVLNYRNILVADANSEVTLIEHGQSAKLASTVLLNTVTQIKLGKAAKLHHIQLQAEDATLSHIANIHAQQAQDSYLFGFNAALGAKLARYDFHSQLQEAGAECVMDGLYVLTDKQHADTHTCVDHLASHTKSDQLYKGVADNQAHGVFNGKAIVHKGIKGISAHQINRNLLLAKTASIDTKPELMIFADDVQCSHGATVGQLDEAALFYLQSRGIPEATARRLLTQAFTAECLSRLPDTIRTWLHQSVTDKMKQHFSEGA